MNENDFTSLGTHFLDDPYLLSIDKHIHVFIHHMAMSGGTLMACAADEIYMGPYSSLGPTDPGFV